MASRAFTTRFRITCSMCPGSTVVEIRSGLLMVVSSMFEPMSRCSILVMFSIRSLIIIVFGSITCFLEKARSCLVRFEALSEAFIISAKWSCRGWSGGILVAPSWE